MELTGNQILFRPFPAAELNEFGLYIPETARKTYNKGVIAKTGKGSNKKPMRLKEGMVCYRVTVS